MGPIVAPYSILTHLVKKLFASLLGEVLGGVDLVWANCCSFVEPDCNMCHLVEEKYVRLLDCLLLIFVGEVLGDVDLVWANCRSFNEADSDICDLADQAQQALRMRWQQEGLPTVTPIPPRAKKQKKDGKKRALDAGGSPFFQQS